MARFLLVSAVQDELRCLAKEHSLKTRVALIALSLAGVLWLILTPGLWIGTGGFLGWICHIVSAYTAYQYAKTHPF